MTRSAPGPQQPAVPRLPPHTAGRRPQASDGGHCQSRLREERRDAAGCPLTRMPAPGLAPADLAAITAVLKVISASGPGLTGFCGTYGVWARDLVVQGRRGLAARFGLLVAAGVRDPPGLAPFIFDEAQPTAHPPLTSHAVTYRIGAAEGPPQVLRFRRAGTGGRR